MAWIQSIPLIGDIINGIFGLVDEAVEDKDEKNKLKASLTEVFNKSDMNKFVSQISAQAQIITAEANSESWIARNWRPTIMLLFGTIILNNYILNPWLSVLFGVNVMMEVPVQMWELLKIGLGGYVVGRSVEKGIKIWKDKP